MLNATLIAVLRDTFGAGMYGGWRRDWRASTPGRLIVWKHHSGSMRVVLDLPGPQHRWITIRIFEVTRGGWTCLADCKMASRVAVLNLLHAYSLIPAEHTSAYRKGVRDTRQGVHHAPGR